MASVEPEPTYQIAFRPREPGEPFTDELRAKFIDLVAHGRRPFDASKALKVPMTYIRKIQKSVRAGEADLRDQEFVASLDQAWEAYLYSREQVININADLGDWRAAKALLEVEDPEGWGKRDLQREKHERERSKHESRLAKAKADLAERSVRQVNGRLVWPSELHAALTDQEREILGPVLEREGWVKATKTDVDDATAERDTGDDAELEALANAWRMRDERSRAVDVDEPVDPEPLPPDP